jgi:hypothetical protein
MTTLQEAGERSTITLSKSKKRAGDATYTNEIIRAKKEGAATFLRARPATDGELWGQR